MMDLSTRSSLEIGHNLNFTELLDTAAAEAAADDFERAAQLHIAAAEYACNVTNELTSYNNASGTYCPRTFDGWSCWNETPAGVTAFAPCPWFISGFDPNLQAHKECLEDGSWFRHPESNVTWSNYTNCVNYAEYQRYKNVVTIYEVGYLVSLCALVISLIIFFSFRSLQCTRVRIHKHLFFSFIMNNSLWLIWYRFVVNESKPVNELNQMGCAFLHLFVHYFLVANYFWMFVEGFFLHTLLVYAFTRAESTMMKGFYAFGWVGPSIPLTLYAVFRSRDEDHNEQKDCWINESKWTLFLSVPVCICLIVSLAFLINILRVLLIKLNANRRTLSTNNRRESSVAENTASLRKEGDLCEDEDGDFIVVTTKGCSLLGPCCLSCGADSNHKFRRTVWLTIKQAAKASLILIPLLGINYFLTPFKPDPESDWAIYYEYIAAISSSLQGLAVSLLFCFCNSEVIAALRRKFARPDKVSRAGDYSYARTTATMVVIRHPNETVNDVATSSSIKNKHTHWESGEEAEVQV
ncbi:calcitonin gene-related peptide type 1 receptor isoform X1 [Folsomia candida]|uniref:Calcitonin receptor n=1 Tax=Folsomia candida TaxID=158441 RepID=A0A226EMU3_FOLCA|nr:calcitonin gene-related peptide type 1 receptor isoform X1 [Folsomia candida]OXA58952.1 Calcitonin receptor [Folsomia candida]